MPRYSLKKALLTQTNARETELLSEGWFTDLATAVAAGGPSAIKDIISSKLDAFVQKAGDMENAQALDMVQRFRKMGPKSLGGKNLEQVERALQMQQKKVDKDKGSKMKKIDPNKLSKLIFGELEESTIDYKGATLRAMFLAD